MRTFLCSFVWFVLACAPKQESKQAQTSPKKQVSSAASTTPPATKNDTTLAFLEGEWSASKAYCNECMRRVKNVNARLRIKQGIMELILDGNIVKTGTLSYDATKKRFKLNNNGTIKVNGHDALVYNSDSNFDGTRYLFTRVKQ